MKEILVSILLPVHRENDFLKTAIQSLLNQTHETIEILFLDNSSEGINPKSWNLSDKVRYLKLPGNYGLSQTLNEGISKSRGEFLARMDFDDVCFQNRISEQVKYLVNNPKVGICGSWAEVIGADIDGNVKPGQVIKRPTDSNHMFEYLLYKNPLLHPTVMMRRSMVIESNLKYRKSFDSAEDLDFWARAVWKFELGNIDIPLLQYRLHESQYSRKDGYNSQFKSSIIRQRHAIIVLLLKKGLRIKALKVLLKNSIPIVKYGLFKINANKFKKFN